MKKPALFLTLILTISIYSHAQVKSLTLVNTEQGPVAGVIENDVLVFKGIPFAQPPIGDLRWKPPQILKSRDTLFRADKYAPACPQIIIPMISDLKYGMSEDCLYLNIWKPVKPSEEKLPVVIWIHGGGFTLGTASQALQNGEQLAAKGIIVISIAYRLGAFGFLSHPELTAESENHVSGNYGILDQIAALQWINKNIEAFGGDPKRITIFGESAGGQSVNILVASPLAKGLFQRAICMSGGFFGYASDKKNEETVQYLKGAEADGLDFARRAGATSLKEMRKLDAGKIVNAQGTGTLGFSYWPVIDGYVIKDDLFNVFQSGYYNEVPVLLGTTSDEGTLFILSAKPADYPEYVNNRFGPFSEKILNYYPIGTNDDSTRRSAANLMRDSYFGWYAYTWANLQNKTGKSSIYVYYFDQMLPNSGATILFKSNKPFHGSDIAYVFGHLSLDPKVKYTDADNKLSETMISYWVNFIKHGDPNGTGLMKWPEYTNDNPLAIQLRWPINVIRYPNLDPIKLFDDYYIWKRNQK